MKKDRDGNTISIEPNGHYKVTNSIGNETASGTTNVTTGLDISSVGKSTVSSLPETTSITPNNTTTTTGTAATTNANGTYPNGTYTFKLSYPIAIDMHLIDNDTSRTEKLSAADRTSIAKTFADNIRTNGYSPLIYGNKEMLLTKMNLAALGGYDIWVYNEGDLPDYPYLMTMWKYDTDSTLIKSLKGDYGVDVCFIDYATR